MSRDVTFFPLLLRDTNNRNPRESDCINHIFYCYTYIQLKYLAIEKEENFRFSSFSSEAS